MEIPWNKLVNVVEQKSGLFAINKPNGLISHPNKPNSIAKNAIVLANYDLIQEAYILKSSKLYLLNRLDSPTSGLILLSNNKEIAEEIRTAFKNKYVEKKYNAIIKGDFLSKFGKKTTWCDFLQESNLKNECIRVHNGGSARAETVVIFIEKLNVNGITLSHIELLPKTGKTHQLRVQCASRKMPILGDKTYGNFQINKSLNVDKLLLHSSFIHVKTKSVDFMASSQYNWPFNKTAAKLCRSWL